MEFAGSLDLPLIEHCEDLHLSAGGDMHEGVESTRLGLRGIPRCSEDVMVARDIILAEVTGVRYHVAHISSANSLAAGASDIWTLERTAHTIGTCRMGTDAGSAVVNSYGRSFDIPNLWISDNSTFPSALPANPALTIMALALRTADRFLADGN